MSRIDRERLESAEFPIKVEVPVRFSDLDMQLHVNNTAAATILQEARVGFDHRAGLPPPSPAARPLVAAITIEFARELHYPGSVEVCTGVVAIGRTSFTLAQVGRQDGRIALYAEVTVVISGEQGPTPIPNDMRAALERLWVGGR